MVVIILIIVNIVVRKRASWAFGDVAFCVSILLKPAMKYHRAWRATLHYTAGMAAAAHRRDV